MALVAAGVLLLTMGRAEGNGVSEKSDGPSQALGDRRVSIDRVDRGLVFWHGHRMESPFVIEASFRMGPDTVWTGTLINGLPLVLKTRPDRAIRATREQEQKRAVREALHRRATSSLATSMHPRNMAGLAAIYNADSTLVDSALVASATSIRIYWRGEPSPEYRSFSWADSMELSGPVRVNRAIWIADCLRRGAVLFIGRGLVVVPAGRAAEVLAQVDSVRRGFATTVAIIKDDHVSRDLRQPQDIGKLLREGD